MKLHLPTALHAALVATMSLAAFALSPAAQAASNYVANYDETLKTLTVKLPTAADTAVDVLLSSGDNETDVTHHANYESAEKIIFALTSSGYGNCWFNSDVEITKAVQIGDGTAGTGLYLNNGSANKTLTLSGALSGTGVISQVGAGGDTARGPKHILITGDTSDFGGNITMSNSGVGKITFGNGTTVPVNAGSSSDGVIGSGTISLADRSKDTLVFNYGGDNTVYVTNSFSGSGTVKNEGTAVVDFNHATFAATTTLSIATTASAPATFSAAGLSGVDNISLGGSFGGRLGNSGAGTLTISGGTLGGAGNDSSGITSVTGGTIGTVSTNSGTTNISGGTITDVITNSGITNISGGTITSINAHDGSTNILADISVTTIKGGDGSVSTINIGSATETATLTVTGDAYGHYEHASSDAASNKTTVNVYGGSTLDVAGMLQVARDGKGILNVNSNATVVAKEVKMSANWNDGSKEQGKYAEMNLNGALYVGANGITLGVNTNSAPGIKLKNGSTLGTSEKGSTNNTYGWTSALGMTLDGTVTVDTITYETKDEASANDQHSSTITLSGVLSDATDAVGSLKKTGDGTLVLSGANTYSGGTTISGGSIKVQNADALGSGAVTVSAGGTLDLSNVTTLNAEGLNLSSGSTLIVGDYLTNGAITLTGSLSVAEGVIIDLSAWCKNTAEDAGENLTVFQAWQPLFTCDSENTAVLESLAALDGTYVTIKLANGYETQYGTLRYDGAGSLLLVPEPTTATLSLLALAGFAARRRRK